MFSGSDLNTACAQSVKGWDEQVIFKFGFLTCPFGA